MNLSNILNSLSGKAEMVLAQLLLSFLTTGKVDFKALLRQFDSNAVAMIVFSFAEELETEHPGIAVQNGWQRATQPSTPAKA